MWSFHEISHSDTTKIQHLQGQLNDVPHLDMAIVRFMEGRSRLRSVQRWDDGQKKCTGLSCAHAAWIPEKFREENHGDIWRYLFRISPLETKTRESDFGDGLRNDDPVFFKVSGQAIRCTINFWDVHLQFFKNLLSTHPTWWIPHFLDGSSIFFWSPKKSNLAGTSNHLLWKINHFHR